MFLGLLPWSNEQSTCFCHVLVEGLKVLKVLTCYSIFLLILGLRVILLHVPSRHLGDNLGLSLVPVAVIRCPPRSVFYRTLNFKLARCISGSELLLGAAVLQQSLAQHGVGPWCDHEPTTGPRKGQPCGRPKPSTNKFPGLAFHCEQVSV